MEDNFIIIGMTPPILPEDEAERITTMLSSGIVDYMHIRHPEAPRNVMEAVINGIPEYLHPKLRIHSHFDLCEKYNLAGAHLNSRWPSYKSDIKRNTKSYHSLLDLWNIKSLEYVTLSPIYASISKPGYVGNFNRTALKRAIRNKRVVALGGVAPDKFKELKQVGFYGAGMLGYLWQEEYQRSLRQIKMFRNDGFYLQYITNGNTPEEVLAEVKPVIEGGCRWIQIRMKEADDATVTKTVKLIAPICHATNTILLLDDRVELAAKIDVDGVHIGRQDMMPHDARKILGELKIIGCTANTIDDIVDIDHYGVADYVGLGPLRNTSTKKNLAPTLGYEKVMEIFDSMHERQIDIPVTVIGGVTISDIPNLLDYGAASVAVSGNIRNADDPKAMTELYLSQLKEH